MQLTNPVLEKLRSGRPSVGSWVCLLSPLSGEILADAGFDWVLVDIEHSAVSMSDIMHCFQAIEAGGAVPMARLPRNDPVWIKRCLDAGALGLVIPMVNTADEARAAVSDARFPPLGNRPYGGGRVIKYGLEYIQSANDNTLLMLQIEHKQAVENIDAILDVPGYDGCFIGPTDLALSQGLPLPHVRGSRELDEQIDRLLGKIRSAGRFAGTTSFTPDLTVARIRQGFQFVTLGSDMMFVRQSAIGGLEQIAQKLADG